MWQILNIWETKNQIYTQEEIKSGSNLGIASYHPTAFSLKIKY
jgi:hypothetical protein